MIKDDKTVEKAKDLTEYTKEELIVECLNLRQMTQGLNQKMDWLMEQVRLGNQKRFAPSSEKTEYQQFSIFNEAEVEADLNKQEPTLEQVTYTRKKKQEGKRDSDLYGLDIETTKYQSYMWLYRTSDKSSTPICLFEYQPTRAKEIQEIF